MPTACAAPSVSILSHSIIPLQALCRMSVQHQVIRVPVGCAGGPALPSAPCIRPRGAVGPSLGFARPGPVNVACCSLGIAPGDPAFHTVGDPCIRTHAAGACKGPATPAPAVGGRSPTWAGTLLGGTHAQPEVICQTHGVPGGLRTSAVRVQPLTTRWTEAVPGACHLAVAGGAIAVACGSGLLLLLDAASGALIRCARSTPIGGF